MIYDYYHRISYYHLFRNAITVYYDLLLPNLKPWLLPDSNKNYIKKCWYVKYDVKVYQLGITHETN